MGVGLFSFVICAIFGGKIMNAKTVISGHEMTPRQGEILDKALSLLVSSGGNVTMEAVARAASCSKETLYNWFGDRDGLLVATVQWQASKVREPELDLARLDIGSLARSLEAFATDLLSVLSGDISVALNRSAIAHAATDSSELGAVVLENGRGAMGRRLKPVLEAGRKASILKFDDSEEAFRTFFGLVVRDVQIRLLLGDPLSPNEVASEAALATRQFLKLYQTD